MNCATPSDSTSSNASPGSNLRAASAGTSKATVPALKLVISIGNVIARPSITPHFVLAAIPKSTQTTEPRDRSARYRAAVRVARPLGTVTFLFTDIEGSAQLWEESPADMAEALRVHDAIVRDTIERHGGYVF